MTPEQCEELKAAAQDLHDADDHTWPTYQARFKRLVGPAAILSLIAQVEALTRKNLESQRVYDERGLQIARLEIALKRANEAKIETQPAHEEIIRTGSMLMCTACGTVSKEPQWDKLPEIYFDDDAAPTIPAIPGTKEGA